MDLDRSGGDARLMNASNIEDWRDLPLDHPRRLLMIAHARLAVRPAPLNGMKLITIAAYGDHAVRLIELPSGVGHAIRRLWVELYDAFADCTLDGSGCKDISEGGPKPRGNPPRGSEKLGRLPAHSPIPF